jgi:hypothetical protein
MARAILVLTATVAAVAATALPAQAKEKPPTVVAPPPTPHVGFYTVHPRVGLSTYYSLSASWPRTQAPLRVIAKVHPAGGTCAADPASDTGTAFGAAWLTRADHHTVWKEWTPAEPGSYVVCTWLGNPVIATNTNQVTVEPASLGVKPVGTLVAAATSESPGGPPRTVFPTAPAHVYARFQLRGVKQGRRVTIEFRDTNGHVVLSRLPSKGPAPAWYQARIPRQRLAARLGYWLVSVRVGNQMLGRIHFLIPDYAALKAP